MSSAEKLVDALRAKGHKLVTAESCTGGLVAAAITDIAGSSDVFERGFVTYSNEAKQDILGVRAETLAEHGAVSEETARAMASGAVAHSRGTISVSITGIAGPGGGSREKPVGLVHFAVCAGGVVTHIRREFGDLGRASVRTRAVEQALQLVFERL